MPPLLAGLLALAAASGAAAQTPVAWVHPQPASLSGELELTGTVTAPLDAALSTQVAGLVAEVPVDAGARVEAGQILLRLDDRLARIALDRAEAELREGRSRLDEARRLRDEALPLAAQGSLPQSDLLAREAEFAQAGAAHERLQAQRAEQAELLARHSLAAPFAGLIRRRLADPGEWMASGDVVLELVATRDLRVDVQVPQRRLDQLRALSRAQVAIDAFPDQAFDSRIAARVPAVDPGSRSFLVRLALDDPQGRVAPGMSARVRFELPAAEQTAVSVPRDALLHFPDGSSIVWLVQADGSAARRPVRLGPQRGERVVVREGLDPQDKVVVRGNEGLKPGQAIEARPHQAP